MGGCSVESADAEVQISTSWFDLPPRPKATAAGGSAYGWGDAVSVDLENHISQNSSVHDVGRDAEFVEQVGVYCPSGLSVADLDDTTIGFPRNHRCDHKCANGCTGPSCFCDGFLPGADSDSDALASTPRRAARCALRFQVAGPSTCMSRSTDVSSMKLIHATCSQVQ